LPCRVLRDFGKLAILSTLRPTLQTTPKNVAVHVFPTSDGNPSWDSQAKNHAATCKRAHRGGLHLSGTDPRSSIPLLYTGIAMHQGQTDVRAAPPPSYHLQPEPDFFGDPAERSVVLPMVASSSFSTSSLSHSGHSGGSSSPGIALNSRPHLRHMYASLSMIRPPTSLYLHKYNHSALPVPRLW